MLNAAMVLMILAGVLGLPAIMCAGCWSSLGTSTGANINAKDGQAVVDFLMYVSIAASLGSIIVGAMVKKLKKLVSGIACFVFAIGFALLLIQGNVFGLVSAGLLIVAGIMIFVAPAEQFKNVQKVQMTSK